MQITQNISLGPPSSVGVHSNINAEWEKLSHHCKGFGDFGFAKKKVEALYKKHIDSIIDDLFQSQSQLLAQRIIEIWPSAITIYRGNPYFKGNITFTPQLARINYIEYIHERNSTKNIFVTESLYDTDSKNDLNNRKRIVNLQMINHQDDDDFSLSENLGLWVDQRFKLNFGILEWNVIIEIVFL